MFSSFRAAVIAVRRREDLYFAALLSEETIVKALGATSSVWRGWVYTPAVTVWVFLSQCLSADHSCREAVARLAAWLVARGRRSCSAQTGAYCTARANLPEAGCRELVRQTGRTLESQAPVSWFWHGRKVRVVDGSTITMPDTPANQAEYPQQSNQKPGCGFPIMRIVVVFSLAVGTVLETAISQYTGKQTGENSLFRTLYDVLEPRDVVLLDRCFSGWFDIALLIAQGVDVVVKKHQSRLTDFRTGRSLGKDDHLVRCPKTARPAWMSAEEYAAMPAELLLREVRVRVTQRGFRTKQMVVVTTLLDAEIYPREEIGDLYRLRWQAELYLRSLKVVLQMDHLRCKAPERVRNEFWMHLLGYNLIRQMMATAALEAGICPWQISFKGALQTVCQFLPLLCSQMPLETGCQALLKCIASHAVADRPDRYEPRLVKRRPKPYKHLREPRANYKKQIQ